jgi:hypothetical protein
MATVRNFEVISDKYNLLFICTSENCALNWSLNYTIINLYLLSSPHRLKHLKYGRRQNQLSQLLIRFVFETDGNGEKRNIWIIYLLILFAKFCLSSQFRSCVLYSKGWLPSNYCNVSFFSFIPSFTLNKFVKIRKMKIILPKYHWIMLGRRVKFCCACTRSLQ